MKRPSEGLFGKALRAIDDDIPTYVYRPPDPKGGAGVSNAKPCDYMVWQHPGLTAWFECKDVDAVNTYPFSDVRDSQWQGIREARRLGIPYWLAIWWRRHKSWTISDGARLAMYREQEGYSSVSRELLMTRFGIQTDQRSLTGTLKSVIADELGG